MTEVPREVLEVRPYPGGGLEVALPQQEHVRLSLFKGSHPPGTPRHPALGRVVGVASQDGDPVWLEERAAGPLLSEIPDLDTLHVATALLDLASGLAALHGCGLAHGRVATDRIVIKANGRAQLIGAGARSGGVMEDLAALRKTMLALWPDNAPAFPDPGEKEAASVVSESLAGWLAYHHPDASDEPWAPSGPEVPELALILTLEPAPEISHLDEIGFDLGPEPDTDRSSTSGTTGGRTDHTRPASALHGASPRRLGLLGQLSAFADKPGDPARFEGVQGNPSEVIKALIADEPLDPLPLPDGVPPMGQAMDPPVIHEVERTATGESTLTRATALTEKLSLQALSNTVVGSLLVILVVGSLVWLLLQA